MANLAEIRKKLQEIEDKASGNNRSGGGSSPMFRFWDMDVDSTTKLRFLPDADEDNVFFWKEKNVIKLPFPGIKGHDEGKEIFVQVPCMHTWGEDDAILNEIKPWWNDEDLKKSASTYWKKRTYLFSGFVLDSTVQEDERENPIRVFAIGPKIYNIIKAALMDPDFENTPTDYLNGTNFNLTKIKGPQYADYGTSSYVRKESPLDEAQLAAIEEHGLVNLNDFIPNKPDAEKQAIIFEMFEASVNGELYDPAKWAKYYRPYGLEYNESTDTKASVEPSATTASEKVAVEDNTDDIPFEKKEEAPIETSSAESSSGVSAEDILAKIRARNNS